MDRESKSKIFKIQLTRGKIGEFLYNQNLDKGFYDSNPDVIKVCEENWLHENKNLLHSHKYINRW